MMAQQDSIRRSRTRTSHARIRHRAIGRLVSPSVLGEVVKPPVFLDLATFEGEDRIPMALKHVRGAQ
jgi:hypothetical protein